MKELNSIMNRIVVLTNTMESEYPELYQFLDENPITLPLFPHPEMDQEIMEYYLQSLQELLDHHVKTRKMGNDIS
ncbi:MAG: hypothetical protein RIM83_08560 [Allomuricauda sp.]